jgi:tetratricopeptide (TPR) repeat protein
LSCDMNHGGMRPTFQRKVCALLFCGGLWLQGMSSTAFSQEGIAPETSAMSRPAGTQTANPPAENTKLASLLKVLSSLGYDTDTAQRIARPLFPLYNKFPPQGSLPARKMRRELEDNVRAIQRDFLTTSAQGRGMNPIHAGIYGLLLNSPAHTEFFHEFVQYFQLLNQTDKEYVERAFQCSYKSYLGWIFLTAKGFNVVPVITYLEKEQREYIAEKRKEEIGLLSFAFSQGEEVADHPREAHVSLIVELAQDQYVYVDVTNSFVSETFSVDDYFCDTDESRCTFLLEDRGDLFRSILMIDQDRMRAILYTYLSGFYTISGQSDKALQALNEAMDFAPDFGYLYYQLGLHHYQQGERELFVSYLEKAVELEPYNDMFYFFLGKFHMLNKDFDAAIRHFERAILNYSKDPLYYEALAYAHTRKSEWPEAVRNYQTVLNLDEDYVKGYINLGMAYMKLGESQYRSKYYSKAESSFESALDCFKEIGHKQMIQKAKEALTFVR